MQNILSILGFLLITIFAASNGQSEPKTVSSVGQCFEVRQSKCHSECANKLPQNKSESVQCFTDLISEGKAEFKKCLSDAGITDSSPCFAFNHTHGKGSWNLKGEHHGSFGGRRGHNHTANGLRRGFGGHHFEHGNGHKFGQGDNRRIQRSVSNSNSSSSSNSTEDSSSEEEAVTKKPRFDKHKKHGSGKNYTDNDLHLGWAKHQSGKNHTDNGLHLGWAKHQARGGKGQKHGQGNSKHNRVARSLSKSKSNSSSTESSSEEKPSASPKRGIGQSKKHGGVQGGRRGDRKEQGRAEIKEYHQCLATCFKSEDAKPCDDGCPAATEQIAAAFKECKKQGLAKGAKGKMAAFKKCLHPEQPLQ